MVVFFFLPWIFPLFGGYTYLVTEVVIWAIFALGFNLVLGRCGLPSFGHGAFYGIGAYAFGLVQRHLLPGFWLPLLLGTLFGGVGAAIFGFFLSRRRGIYFALLSVAFTEVCYFVAFRWDEVTGGEDGLTGGAYYSPMHWMLIYGLLFVFVIAFLPEGILGVFKRKGGATRMRPAVSVKKI